MAVRRGRTFRDREIRKTKTMAFNRENADSSTYYSVLKWMGGKGYKPHKKMKACIFEDTGRGLKTEETIYPDDIIISIPESLLIKPPIVLRSCLGSYIKRCCPDATGVEILSVFLMCERAKGEASFWYPYITTLPRSYTIPAYCSNQVIYNLPAFLKHSAVKQINSVKNSFEKLKTVFTSLENSFPEFHGMFHFDLFLWAWSSVNTRCIYIECGDHDCKGKSCSYHLALAPFLDLLNHHFDAQVKAGFNEERKCYEIKSLKHIKKYSQVFINYGNHSNRQLFVEYGFVLEDNFNDIIPISLDDILNACRSVNIVEDFHRKKHFFLHRSSLLSNTGLSNDGLTWGMDILLKVLCTTKSIRACSSILWDLHLTENETSIYKSLVRTIVMCKLSDLKCSDQEINLKPLVTKNSEFQKILSMVYYLCSLEEKMLLKILHHLEN